MRIRSVIVVGALSLAAMVCAPCGGESEQDRIGAVIMRFQEDMSAGRLRSACSVLARRPRVQIGSIGHDRKPTTCPQDVDYLFRAAKGYAGNREVDFQEASRPKIVSIHVASGGRTAAAMMVYGDGDPFRVALVNEHGEWKLNDFFGEIAPAPGPLR